MNVERVTIVPPCILALILLTNLCRSTASEDSNYQAAYKYPPLSSSNESNPRLRTSWLRFHLGEGIEPIAVNNDGTVILVSGNPPNSQYYRRSLDGTTELLSGTPSRPRIEVMGVNNGGDAWGAVMYSNANSMQAAWWPEGQSGAQVWFSEASDQTSFPYHFSDTRRFWMERTFYTGTRETSVFTSARPGRRDEIFTRFHRTESDGDDVLIDDVSESGDMIGFYFEIDDYGSAFNFIGSSPKRAHRMSRQVWGNLGPQVSDRGQALIPLYVSGSDSGPLYLWDASSPLELRRLGRAQSSVPYPGLAKARLAISTKRDDFDPLVIINGAEFFLEIVADNSPRLTLNRYEARHLFRDLTDFKKAEMISVSANGQYVIARTERHGPLNSPAISHGFLFSRRSCGLYVDLDRDSLITVDSDVSDGLANPDAISLEKPFRFWVNDDDDDGDIAFNDLPGQAPSVNGGLLGAPGADWRTLHGEGVVDGTCDLIDFFPVFLDIKELLLVLPPTTPGIAYKLKHAEDALNFVYTDLARSEAFHYLTRSRQRAAYGYPDNETLPQDAATIPITAAGVPLNATFLNRIEGNPNKGVILVEGRQPTTQPLRLVVEKGGVEVAEIALHLKISPVDDFYRWINLRGACGQNETRPTNLNQPPAYPDALTNGKMFVWVHGYNVNEEQSRGWNAEAFKRMWHSGSKAMFTAVSWNGDHSQLPIVRVAPDYWDNIPRAFTTAEALAPLVNSLPGSSKVIAGHSMGNVVVSSAIKDHGMSVTKYLMVDAAVALEAYDTSVSTVGPYYVNAMRPYQWIDYSRRLWSADWWKLFPEGDNRRRLTWMNRFGEIPNALNIYSSGEEVLNNNDLTPGERPPLGTERVWIQQEMNKGGIDAMGVIAGILAGEIQGGWGFNQAWGSQVWTPDPGGGGSYTYFPPSVADANALTDAQIRAQPFFERFDKAALMHADVGAGSSGSDAADEAATADLLGGAIPALSFPAGRNPVPLFLTARNRDLMTYQDGWPASRLSNQDRLNRWLHSDIRDVAYFFNYRAWDLFTDEGNLR